MSLFLTQKHDEKVTDIVLVQTWAKWGTLNVDKVFCSEVDRILRKTHKMFMPSRGKQKRCDRVLQGCARRSAARWPPVLPCRWFCKKSGFCCFVLIARSVSLVRAGDLANQATPTRAPAPMAAQPITCKAMVAFGVNDLREEEIVVAPPKAGEVRVKVCRTELLIRTRILCRTLCRTLCYTLSLCRTLCRTL